VVRVWQAWASNHSASTTMIGRFASAELAEDVGREIRAAFRAHLEYLATLEGQALDFDQLQMPTPPLLALGQRWGFDWGNEDTNTFWWESMEPPHPGRDLTVVAEGNEIQIFHPYHFGFPELGLRRYVEARGGKVLYLEVDDRLPVRIRARGVPPGASGELKVHLEALAQNRAFRKLPGNTYETPPFDRTPPWGETVDDPRFGPDEERLANLSEHVEQHLEVRGDEIEALLYFMQPFHGAIAASKWLRLKGAQEVDVSYVLNG
jgi:hypothetical protein